MPVLFISYRRDDSGGHAGRLFDRLREHFGRDNVFLDVVGIDAGVDFVDTLEKAVGSCDVLLAVIGREWLTCTDRQGKRRLDDANDFIRAEISTALQRNVRVVPVLVQGAAMPPTDEIPDDLKRLTRRQAVELRDSRWDADVEALIANLESAAARAAPAPKPVEVAAPASAVPIAPPSQRIEPAPPGAGAPASNPRRRALLGGAAAVVVALITVALYLSFGGKETVSLSPSEPAPDGGSPATSEPADRAATPPKKRPENPAAPTPVPPAEPQPDGRIEVPNVVGSDLDAAKKTMHNAGFEGADLSWRSEPSPEPKGRVLSQEPAGGSRVEKGTQAKLVYALGTTVTLYIPEEGGDREAAEGLASYLRSLKLPGIDYQIAAADLGIPPGQLLYSAADQASLAKTIADRSSAWLSKRYGRPVELTTEHDHNIGVTALWLLMPAAQ